MVPANATGVKYKWESANSEIVTVDTTGKVTATGFGETEITVSYGSVKATVAVAVGLENIIVKPVSITVAAGENQQLTATAVPEGEVTFIWESSNPEIATVDTAGKVTGVSVGTTNITVSYGTITKSVAVIVDQYDRTGWTAECRNATHPWGANGGEPYRVFDGDRNTGWHSAGGTPFPQCLVIDTKESRKIDHLVLWHLPQAVASNWIYFKTIEVYLSDTPVTPNDDPSSWGNPAAVYNYPGGIDPVTINLEPNSQGQYVILLFPDWNGAAYISFTELNVYAF
jgi:hypothetical protein